MNKPSLLLIEDDQEITEILAQILSPFFDLTIENDGNDAYVKVLSGKFQIVITDINLPTMNGIDILKNLHQLAEDIKPGIIVVSGDSSDSTIKQAYELGVDDFICKPFKVPALIERVKGLSSDIERIEKFKQTEKQQNKLIQNIMSQSSAYGHCLDLILNINLMSNFDDLAKVVLNYLSSMQLNAVLEIRSPSQTYHYGSTNNPCPYNEKKIFELLKDKGRVYHFGKRCVFNDSDISIFIKNMPEAGSELYDVMVDVIAKLVPVIDSKINNIVQIQTMTNVHEKLIDVTNVISQEISTSNKLQKSILQNIEAKINQSFHVLDMNEEQEKYFVNLFHQEIKMLLNSEKLSEIEIQAEQCINELEIPEQPVEVLTNDEDLLLF